MKLRSVIPGFIDAIQVISVTRFSVVVMEEHATLSIDGISQAGTVDEDLKLPSVPVIRLNQIGANTDLAS